MTALSSGCLTRLIIAEVMNESSSLNPSSVTMAIRILESCTVREPGNSRFRMRKRIFHRAEDEPPEPMQALPAAAVLRVPAVLVEAERAVRPHEDVYAKIAERILDGVEHLVARLGHGIAISP